MNRNKIGYSVSEVQSRAFFYNGKFYQFKFTMEGANAAVSFFNISASKVYERKHCLSKLFLRLFSLANRIEGRLVSKKSVQINVSEFIRLSRVRDQIFKPTYLSALNRSLTKAVREEDFVGMISSLEAGADPAAFNDKSYCASLLNCNDDELAKKLIHTLENSGANTKALFKAAIEKDANSIIEALFEEHELDSKEITEILFMATRFGRRELVKALLLLSTSLTQVYFEDKNILHLAVENGQAEVLKELVKNNPAFLNSINTEGDSPMTLAAKKGHSACLMVLIEAGADVNARDRRGKTPIYWAFKKRNRESFMLLIDACADILTTLYLESAFYCRPALYPYKEYYEVNALHLHLKKL